MVVYMGVENNVVTCALKEEMPVYIVNLCHIYICSYNSSLYRGLVMQYIL